VTTDTPRDKLYRDTARRIVEIIYPEASPERKGNAMRTVVHQMRESLALMTHDIREFHEKFGLGYDGPPRLLSHDLRELRAKRLIEEAEEYLNADLSEEQDEDGVNFQATPEEQMEAELDALVDVVYVALGTAYLSGYPFAKAWQRVHAANMAKVRAERAEDSKHGSTYDIIKPEGWVPPSHKDLLFPSAEG